MKSPVPLGAMLMLPLFELVIVLLLTSRLPPSCGVVSSIMFAKSVEPHTLESISSVLSSPLLLRITTELSVSAPMFGAEIVLESVVAPVTPSVPPTVWLPVVFAVPAVKLVTVVVARVAEFVATRSVVVAVLLTMSEPVVSKLEIVAEAAEIALVMVAESAERAPENVAVVPVSAPERVSLLAVVVERVEVPVTERVPPIV